MHATELRLCAVESCISAIGSCGASRIGCGPSYAALGETCAGPRRSTGPCLRRADLDLCACRGGGRTYRGRSAVARRVRGAIVSRCRCATAEFVFIFFAIQRLAPSPFPIDVRLLAGEVGHVLADSGARVLLHDENLASRLPRDRMTELQVRPVGVPEPAAGVLFGQPSAHHPTPDPQPIESEEHVALILYTSGTTGKPKGAGDLAHSTSPIRCCTTPGTSAWPRRSLAHRRAAESCDRTPLRPDRNRSARRHSDPAVNLQGAGVSSRRCSIAHDLHDHGARDVRALLARRGVRGLRSVVLAARTFRRRAMPRQRSTRSRAGCLT
jgi:hypothetical protein